MDVCHFTESHLHHQHCNLSGSLDDGVLVTQENKGDAQISIGVDIMDACNVCKGKICPAPSFHQCY